MMSRKDLKGKVFGRLTVQEIDHFEDRVGGGKRAFWKCKCSCGNIKIISAGSLNDTGTKSCGCINKERLITHGKSKSSVYNIWAGMKARCYNEKHISYSYYGGKGIKVCARWLESFENFYEDMGDCFEGLSIDRIDGNKDYELSNCRWSSKSEQTYNRRSAINKTGRTGVSYSFKLKKWKVELKQDYKYFYKGYYKDFEDAVQCVEQLELDLWGCIRENVDMNRHFSFCSINNIECTYYKEGQ